MDHSESERLMSLLRKAMRMLDVKHRDLARRLGVSPSYLSRLFHGVIDLKVDQLVRIVEALGLGPGEFFRMAYPEDAPAPSPAAAALRGLVPEAGALQPAAAPAATPVYVTAEEVERKIEDTVRRLFAELGKSST
jgi:transcriptional regulator with XRE-family HTH domain